MVCRLETGRTHQIRVHAQYAGFALLGDPTYKLKGAGQHSALNQLVLNANEPEPTLFARQALHATHLSFPMPSQFAQHSPGQALEHWAQTLDDLHWPAYTAPPPQDFLAVAMHAGIDAQSELVQEVVHYEAEVHRVNSLAWQDTQQEYQEEWTDDDSVLPPSIIANPLG
jgi:23S rRNA pseudouridine1911/1915/1917 synthase